ncbi:MAG: hypothetical protein WA990_03435 [Rubrobacteraceae bacterium]
MAELPPNVIFLIALLVIMAALVIFTLVFSFLVDRKLKKEDRNQKPQNPTSNGESS